MRILRPTHLLWAVAAAVSVGMATVPLAGAHPPGPTLSGYGTPVIDGVLSPGEWDAAARHAFPAAVPSNDGGGTTPATLLVMNDGVNLYFAIEVQRSGPPRGSFVMEFDNDHDGQLYEEGDDVFVANPGPNFFDDFRTSQPPCPANVVCGFLDTQAGGTNDGRSFASGNGTVHVYEVERPLDSADDLHDFSLSLGSTVGFQASIQVWSVTPSCNFGPSCVAATAVPSFGTGDVVVSAGSGTPQYPFSGFLATFRNPPVINEAHSDGVQTFWFRLGGDRGLDVVAAAESRRIDCATGDAIGSPEPAVTPSWTGLFYQAYTGRYAYPWKTTTAYKDTCREFALTLADGSVHTARLHFLK